MRCLLIFAIVRNILSIMNQMQSQQCEEYKYNGYQLMLIVQRLKKLDNYFFSEKYHTLVIDSSRFTLITVIRVISLLYLTSIYIWSISKSIQITGSASFLNNIIYLTMIGYFITWLYFLLSVQHILLKIRGFAINQRMIRYIEIIYEIAFCIQLPITIVFWGFLFRILVDNHASSEVLWINANLHAGPLILVIVDMVFNPYSFPIKDVCFILIFTLVYMIINMVYTLWVHLIYQPIDWKSLKSYSLIVASFAMSLVMFWLGGFIYNRCKKKIATRMNSLQTLLTEEQSEKERQQESP